MVTLAQFHGSVSAAIKRGTSQDASIPGWTRRAAKDLEQDYTWQHMWQTAQLSVSPGDLLPAPLNIKEVDYFREVIPGFDGSKAYRLLTPVAPRNVASFDSPSGFWRENNYFRLDGALAAPTIFEYRVACYTTWPTDTSASPDLLQVAESALLNKVMMFFATEAKDQRMYQMYQDQLSAALSEAQRAQEAGYQSGQSFRMSYNPAAFG